MKLEARNLTKIYSGKKVVKDVSLNLKKGEIVGLLGPNGAGKTTSFYMIVGLMQIQALFFWMTQILQTSPCTKEHNMDLAI